MTRCGVMVTGGAGAIGVQLARAFAEKGYLVAVVDRDEAQVEAAVSGLRGEGHTGIVADLATTDLDDLMIEASDQIDTISTLVHAAAVLLRRDSIFDVTDADLDLQVSVNFTTSFRLNRAFAKLLISNNRPGSIVNFVSQGWWTGGFGGSIVYNASKGAVVTMTKGLARTLAEHNIRVNAVAPGMVDTPMLREGMTEHGMDALISATPMKRLAQPSEMCGAALFLASDEASFITGSVVNVSGGFLMY